MSADHPQMFPQLDWSVSIQLGPIAESNKEQNEPWDPWTCL